METSYLRAFLLVVESGSMSEAARRLEITPAAVAHQLKLLERELGTRLLGRAGRTVAPTEAGHRLVERAAAILRDIGELKAAINDDAATRELRLGAINTALHSVVPEILAGLARQPQLRVRRSPGSSVAYLGLNLRDPRLAARRVREAVALAIDRERLVRFVLGGAARPATGLLAPEHWAYAALPARSRDDTVRAAAPRAKMRRNPQCDAAPSPSRVSPPTSSPASTPNCVARLRRAK